MNGSERPRQAASGRTPARSGYPAAVIVAVVCALTVSLSQPVGAQVSFRPRTDFVTGAEPLHVFLVDLNADGRLDLVTAGNSAGALRQTVSVRLGDGIGGFGPISNTDIPADGWMGTAVGDLNGDGKLDLVLGTSPTGSIVVLPGTGTGAFGPSIAPGVELPYSVRRLAIADLNQDGKMDLVADTGGLLYVLLGTGNGQFGPPAEFQGVTDGRDLVVADANGDGKLDVVTAGYDNEDYTISVRLGAGNGTFGPPILSLSEILPDEPTAIALADLNGDGKLDLAAMTWGNRLVVSLGAGTGQFGPPTVIQAGPDPVPGDCYTLHDVAVADINADGKPDVVAVDNCVGAVSILLGTGTGEFGPWSSFSTGLGPLSLVVADLNGDDTPDLAVGTYVGWAVSVLLNTSACSADVTDGIDFGGVAVGASAVRSFTVTNIGSRIIVGDAATSGAFSIVSGDSWRLGPGESASVPIRFTPTSAATFSGGVTFTGCPSGARPVTGVGTGADLRVTALSNPPPAAMSGTRFTIDDTVRNSGAASGPSAVRFHLSTDPAKSGGDVRLGSGRRDVPELASGAQSSGTTSVGIPVGIAPGAYFVLACADDKRDVSETDERNNCRASTTTVVVASAADLRVMSVTAPPATARVGDTFAVTDTTRNQGAIASVATRTRHYLTKARYRRSNGDHLLAPAREVGALGPGEESGGTVIVTVPGTVVAGDYYLTACADDDGAVTESHEENNCRASPTTVAVRPDLRLMAVTDPSASLAREGTFEVTETVKNLGSVGAGTSMTRYYLSADAVKDAGDRRLAGGRGVAALAAGAESTGTATVRIPSTVPLGTYRLLACADGDGTLIESNETNNCRASTTTITVTSGP